MRLGVLLALCAVWVGATACASRLPEPEPRRWTEAAADRAGALEGVLAAAEPAAPDEVVVRLAFGREADLDLYVTDPARETVYFANTPARSGGALEADLRCGGGDGRGEGDAVRVETVRFPAAAAGRYRVGIDCPETCDGGRGDVPYALAVDVGGERRISRGLARWLVFDTIVVEFDVPDAR